MRQIKGTDRVKRLYDRLQKENNRVSIDRARYFTESFMMTEGQAINVRFAKALRHAAEHITLYIDPDQLFAGQIGGPERYGVLYPELDACFFRELKTVLADRNEATFELTEEDRVYLAEKVAPFWEGKSYYEAFSQALSPELLRLTYEPGNRQRSRYLINETQTMNSATQWVHNYETGLKIGFAALEEDAKQQLAALSEETDAEDAELKLTREEGLHHADDEA